MWLSKLLTRTGLAFLATSTLCLPVLCSPQALNGTMVGTVSDSSGAAIANAKATMTEKPTALVHRSNTNKSGNYGLPGLPLGNYKAAVESTGFETATQGNIYLLNNSTVRVDVSLEPGNASETILVTTAPPLLQTDRADINTKIGTEQVVNMPPGTNRNFQSLLNLFPGTAPATFQHSLFFNSASSLQTELNGLPREGILYQIKGIDHDEPTGLLQIIIPAAEAIAAVDISTNNLETELGRATGAVANATPQPGTNKFHGSLFEFIQNKDLNARFFFSGPLGHLSDDYFGGSVGGPIKKDKHFIFEAI